MTSAAPYDETYFQRSYFADHPGKRRSAANLVRQLRREGLERGRVLDVGSGPGFVLRSLLEAGYEAAGMDHSPQALELASGLGPEVELRQGDVCEQIPWGAEAFDAVVLRDVIEHLPSPGAALGEIHRVLRPDALLLVSTLNRKSILHTLLGRRWSFYQDPTHLTMYDRASLEALLRASGFAPVRATTFFDLNTAGETTPWLTPLRRLPLVLPVPRFGECVTVLARKADAVE